MNKYDQQIVKLTATPFLIPAHWEIGIDLFAFIGRNEMGSGCLTMIRADKGSYKAFINGEVDYELTDKIHNDERIPDDVNKITVEHLPVFKEYQELVDKLDPNRE